MNYDDEANTETEAPEPDMNAEIRRAAGHDTQLQPELGWRPSSPPEDRINALERERDGLVRGLAETSEALKIAENQAADGDRLYAGLRLNYERATQQLLELEDAHHVRRRDAREERDARMALQTAVDEINALATMLIDAQAATKIDLRRRLHAIHVKAAYALDTAERFLNPRSSTGGPTIYPEPTERPRRSPVREGRAAERSTPMTGEEINEPDHRIDVWRGDDGDWYWHKIEVGNGAIIADGGEGFTTREHAVTAAEDANPGVEVNIEE